MIENFSVLKQSMTKVVILWASVKRALAFSHVIMRRSRLRRHLPELWERMHNITLIINNHPQDGMGLAELVDSPAFLSCEFNISTSLLSLSRSTLPRF